MNHLFGNVCLTQPEARKLDAFLLERETHADEADHPVIQRLRDDLKRTFDPEQQYADMSVYEMPGAEPGWKAAA